MFSLDRWEEILTTMWRNKLRTFLTSLGVFWGIYMLVALLGSGNGLENGVSSMFAGFDANSMYIWPQRTTMPYKGLKPGRGYAFNNADIEALKREVPELKYICPRMQLGGFGSDNNVGRGSKTGSYSIYGDYPEFIHVQLLNLTQGRFINKLDLAEKRKVCAIGEIVVRELFAPGEDPIGKYIKVQGVYFKVIGVFGTNKQGNEAMQDLTSIFIPFTTCQQAFNWGDKFGWFALSVFPQFSSELVEAKVKDVLKAQHSINPADDRAVGSFNAASTSQRFSNLFLGISFLVSVVGIGTLFAGGVGVMNIMLITVNERTKEIGIRKAMGATPFSIISMIVQEAVFLTFVAGFIGLGLGVLTLNGVDALIGDPTTGAPGGEPVFFLHPEIGLPAAVFSIIVLLVIGLLSGLYPATKAVRIDPIKALRTE